MLFYSSSEIVSQLFGRKLNRAHLCVNYSWVFYSTDVGRTTIQESFAALLNI